MSALPRREWYARVNAAWPKSLPPLTAEEAERAARRLYRFVKKRTWKGPVVIRPHGGPWGKQWRAFAWTRVNRGTREVGRSRIDGRIVTVKTGGELAMAIYPEAGWKELVHLMSHYLGPDGHNSEHARCELRMIKEVVRRGWLDGKLKTEPKPPKPAPDKRALKHERTVEAIKRWESKERRAKTALKKLRRRLAAYERERREPERVAA